MPRRARKKSSTGIYHIMIRGVDKRVIFMDDEDCCRFLDSMQKAKRKSGFQLYAYCLMGNHVHLFLKEEAEPLEIIFRRVGSSYAHYFNWKYQLHGHFYQDRFRSEIIETDEYFLDVVRYICQNPVKAGLCGNPFDYPWLGCSRVTEKDDLLDDFENYTDLRGESLLRFVNEPCDGEHLEYSGAKRLTDREAAEHLQTVCGCESVLEIAGLSDDLRYDAVEKAIDCGISIRQLSRLTGISKSIIERICREIR